MKFKINLLGCAMFKRYIRIDQIALNEGKDCQSREFIFESDNDHAYKIESFQAAFAFIYKIPSETTFEDFVFGAPMNKIIDYAQGYSYQVYDASPISASATNRNITLAGRIKSKEVTIFMNGLIDAMVEKNRKLYGPK